MSASMSRLATPSALVVLAVVAAASVVGTLGADSRWVAALGRAIVDDGRIPDGVPYATAPSDGWPNVLALAQLVLWAFEAGLGDRGLLLAQLAAVAFGISVLAHTATRAGASEGATALVLAVVAVGALEHIVVARLELFSLAIFPLLLALLHREGRQPSRRIWLLVPLVALWSNLHGAVLAGLAVAGAYLLLDRARHDTPTAVSVLAASTVALAATPALARTPDYYRGVLENEAARRGVGLWAPLSFASPFDLLLLGAAAILLVFALRARPRLWELVALAGLALLTARAARGGIWLLYAAAVPAARAPAVAATVRSRLAVPLVALFAGVAVLGVVRGPLETGASTRAVDAALAVAQGTSILAEPIVGEQIALAGGRVWMTNPIDAFPETDQALYLDWTEGKAAGVSALRHASRVVVVRRDAPPARLVDESQFAVAFDDGKTIVYRRRR